MSMHTMVSVACRASQSSGNKPEDPGSELLHS